jgi:hypothetical protein
MLFYFIYSATFLWRELIGHSDPNVLFYIIYSATFLWRELIGHSDPKVYILFIYSATFLWHELIGYSSPKDRSTEGARRPTRTVSFFAIVIIDNFLQNVFSFVWLLTILRAAKQPNKDVWVNIAIV